MAVVSGVVLPNNGDRIKAENYNDPITKILAQVNGNLDDANITSVSGTKIGVGSIPYNALDDDAQAQIINPWISTDAPSAVTYNGNRSYTLTTANDLSGTLSPGMRLRTTRTVAAPTQSTSLNGSSQYYSKSSPSGMTFTDDFVVSAWIKVSSFPGSNMAIVSRYSGGNGWILYVTADTQITLAGYSGGGSNWRGVSSKQSVPLNRWVHITAQLDMSANAVSSTQSYVMMDGVDVPATAVTNGTSPTSLTQAGNLEVGSWSGGLLPFAGKIAQVAVFNSKVTQATMKGYISQGLSGSETSLISAYSFNNSINDLNTSNANNLTANGSAVATNADSPFGGQADGTISATLDYAIIQKVTSSTVIVQTAEGCAIPTTGGVSAVSYSSSKNPYGFPGRKDKWEVTIYVGGPSGIDAGSTSAKTWASLGALVTVPVGEWNVRWQSYSTAAISSSTFAYICVALSTSSSAPSDPLLKTRGYDQGTVSITSPQQPLFFEGSISASSQTSYYALILCNRAATSLVVSAFGSEITGEATVTKAITLDNAYL